MAATREFSSCDRPLDPLSGFRWFFMGDCGKKGKEHDGLCSSLARAECRFVGLLMALEVV